MNTKRMRGRFHRSSNNNNQRHHNNQAPLNRNHVFDSNGPDGRLRGTAQQLFEKYLQHGRDATSAGDRVLAEGYFQHAEHYFRILNAMVQASQQNAQQRQARQPNVSFSQEDSAVDENEAAEEEKPEVDEVEVDPEPPPPPPVRRRRIAIRKENTSE